MKKKFVRYSSCFRFEAILITGSFLFITAIAQATTWFVNDASLSGDVFTTAPGSNLNPGTSEAPFSTIAHAVATAAAGDVILVDAGVYEEDILVDKSLTLTGAGINKTYLWGVKASVNPYYAAFFVTGSNIIIEGFTIGRNGNNVLEWKQKLNTSGVGLLNASNVTIRNNKFAHNRTAIDINSSNGCFIHNNVIDFNRTGMFIHNQCHNNIIRENFIINSWVIGVLWVSSETNDAFGTRFYNNNISGSGYTNIENRNELGGFKDFANNWLGSCTPIAVVSPPRVEPDDSLMIPVEYGGSYIPPTSTAVAVRGSTALALSQIIYTPFLKSPVDMDIDNGDGIIGFQGNYTTGTTSANAGPDVTLYKGYDEDGCVTLTAIGPTGYSYSWSNGGTTQSTSVCPEHTKTYTVTVTDNEGCLATSCDKVTVKITDVRCNKGNAQPNEHHKYYKVLMCNKEKGKAVCIINKEVETHLKSGFTLGPCALNKTGIATDELEIVTSPNPFSGAFNITYAGSADLEAIINIYDMTGKLVETATLAGFNNEIYMGRYLAPGLYSVIFTQGDTRKTFRIIKAE